MRDKPRLKLSEKESRLLHDLCFARMKTLEAGDADSRDVLPVHDSLGETEARMLVAVFNFYQSVYSDNAEAVKRQATKQHAMGPHAGVEYHDRMLRDYRGIMDACMQEGEYTDEDIQKLHGRVTGFIREQKASPARTLYIADCHFYHDRICRELDNRGFSGFEEMNEHMIAQWNGKVKSRDEVYILGDFSISKADATARILSRLNGKLHLIRGNHDKYLEDRYFQRSWFRTIDDYLEIRDNGRSVILSHYPVFCYKGQYRKDKDGRPLTYMLYGHVHNTHDEVLINRFIMESRRTLVRSRHSDQPEPIPCHMINCFCIFSNYQPMTLDEWIVIDRERRGRNDNADRRPGDNGNPAGDAENRCDWPE